MKNGNKYSRMNKHKKRRTTTKYITILSIIGSVLLLFLIGSWVFGGSSDEAEMPNNISNPKKERNDKKDNASKDFIHISEDDEDDEDDDNVDRDNDEKVEKERVESTDNNVLEAYTGNWKPIGTQQEGPHTTEFNQGSQDWKEMEQAIRLATGLEENNMITHWIGNNGDQKVVGTVSNKEQTEIYRVFLSWVDQQGWQPTKVEILKELDV